MSALFAQRLRSARIMNGLSLQALADKMKIISKQALHKYEKGEYLPDTDMIIALANALNVRPEYFSREHEVALENIEFRKLKRFSLKKKNQVIEKTREMLSRYLELEEIIGNIEAFNNPVKGMNIQSFDDVEEASKKVRKVWKMGLDPIYNLIELLEDNHIKVIELDIGDGFDGLQTMVNGKIPVIVLNTAKIIESDRKRFTTLHELGHLLIDLERFDKKEQEKYCHYFAGAVLFPKETAIKELGIKRKKIHINELSFLKKQYGISIQALLYRLKNLEIISESYFRQYMFFISQMGWRKEEPVKYEGEEKSNRFIQLIFRALSQELISMSKAAALNNQRLSEFRQQYMLIG